MYSPPFRACDIGRHRIYLLNYVNIKPSKEHQNPNTKNTVFTLTFVGPNTIRFASFQVLPTQNRSACCVHLHVACGAVRCRPHSPKDDNDSSIPWWRSSLSPKSESKIHSPSTKRQTQFLHTNSYVWKNDDLKTLKFRNEIAWHFMKHFCFHH